jgi:hypothetical protein
MAYETKDFPSKTYKVKVPDDICAHSAYFIIVGEPPEMFFFNSKAMESFQWIVAVMTGLSRQIEAGVEIEKIIDDMKETFDPGGAYIIPDGSGRKVHSVVHHLGLILEQHIAKGNDK